MLHSRSIGDQMQEPVLCLIAKQAPGRNQMKETRIQNIICWSGGKDSTASVILAHEKHIPIDYIVMSIVWFDKRRGIYAENPKHIHWILNYAKPMFESWGYKVVLVDSDKDYMYWFHKVKTDRCKNSENIGKKYGWLLGGMCKMNRSKVEPIKRFFKGISKPFVVYEGIAVDEAKRLESMHAKRNHQSILEMYRMNEFDAYSICLKYNLLSPIYDGKRRRQGCWFCPNQSYEEMADTKIHYPELWHELEQLNTVENLSSRGFRYGVSFDKVNILVDEYIKNPPPKQLNLFESLYLNNNGEVQIWTSGKD